MIDNYRIVFGILVIAIFSGCSTTSNPRDFESHVTVAPNVNPDHQGRPSPVSVKIYQLIDISGFQEADFFSLYDDGPKTLGKDLISVVERELQPGAIYEFTTVIDEDTRYIAVLAAFRNIERAQWRMAVGLPEEEFFDFLRSRVLQINLTDLTISTAILLNREF